MFVKSCVRFVRSGDKNKLLGIEKSPVCDHELPVSVHRRKMGGGSHPRTFGFPFESQNLGNSLILSHMHTRRPYKRVSHLRELDLNH